MKSLLLRIWQWLGRILGQNTAADDRRPTTDHGPQTTDGAAPPSELVTPNSPLVTPVTLPPPLPPQMDIHAGEQAQFGRKASLLSRNEEKLYRTLLSAVRSDYQVMAKVRLWDILWLTNEPPDRKQHLSRLSCRHVDFLLCEPLTLKPLMAIELDDYSHQNPYAQESDRYKNELFAAARLPLLRLPHSNFPPRQLRNKIEAELGNVK